MIKKLLILLFLILSISALSVNKSDAMGIFYTNATYPVTATGAQIKDLSKLKQANVTTTNILFLIEKGDASIEKAIQKAGITKITHIDVQEKSIFIFYRKLTVKVYGE